MKILRKPLPKSTTSYPDREISLNLKKDTKTKRAVERNIEIIGEALSRIVRIVPDVKISDSRKIIDTRNRIIHGYDSVSDDVIWLIVIRFLPILEKEIKEIK